MPAIVLINWSGIPNNFNYLNLTKHSFIMKPKYFLTLLSMIAFCGPILCQSGTSLDYDQLMKTQKDQYQEFIKMSDALKDAGSNYVSSLEKILETDGTGLEGTNKRDSKDKQNQYEWMVNVVPTYVSVSEDKKKLNENIEGCVSKFGEAFNLSSENKSTLKEHLNIYANTYKKYWVAYNKLLDSMYEGKIPPPPLPPPPPPSQQHHRGN